MTLMKKKNGLARGVRQPVLLEERRNFNEMSPDTGRTYAERRSFDSEDELGRREGTGMIKGP